MSKVFEALRRLETEPDNISSMLVADAKTILQEPSPAPAEDEAFATTGPPVDFAVAPTQSGTRVMPVRVSIESPLIPFEDTHEKAAEQYRIIRTKLVQHPASPRVIVISSVDSGDGKTVTSINLAATLALKSQVTVLLIDGDLRRGAIADLLGIPETPGLADVLGKTCSRADAIVQLEQFGNLHVLPAGTRLTNPTELLDSPQWQLLIQELRQDFEYIIVDSPPLNLVADCDLIQAVSDGILMVLRPDYTNRTRCLNALTALPSEKLVGVILNCVEDWFLVKGDSYYSYARPTGHR